MRDLRIESVQRIVRLHGRDNAVSETVGFVLVAGYQHGHRSAASVAAPLDSDIAPGSFSESSLYGDRSLCSVFDGGLNFVSQLFVIGRGLQIKNVREARHAKFVERFVTRFAESLIRDFRRRGLLTTFGALGCLILAMVLISSDVPAFCFCRPNLLDHDRELVRRQRLQKRLLLGRAQR